METAEMDPLHQKWISYGGLQNETQTSNTTYFQVIDGSQLVQHREGERKLLSIAGLPQCLSY